MNFINQPIKSKNSRCVELFEKFYVEITSQPIIKKAKNHKAVTAAYLFTLHNTAIAFGNEDIEEIKNNASQITSLLRKKYLSASEIVLCDKVLNMFGELVRVALFISSNTQSGDKEDRYVGIISNLKMRYFDLIKNPKHINNYEKSFMDFARENDIKSVLFSEGFSIINDLTDEYVSLII